MSFPAPAAFLDRDGTLIEHAGGLDGLEAFVADDLVEAASWLLRQAR